MTQGEVRHGPEGSWQALLLADRRGWLPTTVGRLTARPYLGWRRSLRYCHPTWPLPPPAEPSSSSQLDFGNKNRFPGRSGLSPDGGRMPMAPIKYAIT